MHQVFYIDIEEEVTSIIDRLRKSKSIDNVFVIPMRALILGSSVSLKLIKKKADDLKKNILVVTQDEQGRALAKKVGFETRDSLEGIDIHPDTISGALDENEYEEDEELLVSQKPIHLEVESSDVVEVPRRSLMSDMKGRKTMSGIKSSGLSMDMGHRKEVTEMERLGGSMTEKESEPQEHVLGFDVPKESEMGFQQEVYPKYPEPSVEKKEVLDGKNLTKTGKISKKLKIIFWAFPIFCVFLIGGIFAYMFLPKADIHVYPQTITEKIDISARAQTDAQVIDVENRIIRAKLIEVNDSMIVNKESTGEELASNQKARGRITIYNEFSEDSQQLVATTRFESSDGKIFRIVKGVVVPGMKEEDGKIVPGSVEADVVADEPGDEYNIDPDKFTIPGFKTSPKYQKFYARSEKKMLGGGSQGEMVSVVSSADVESVKKETEEKLKNSIIEKIESNLEEGYVLDHDSVEIEIISSGSFPVENSVAKSFEYQMEMKLVALVFSEKDLIELIQRTVENKAGYSDGGFSLDSIELEYGQIGADFEEQWIDVSVHSSVSLRKDIDREEILNGFLGIKLDDLGSVVNQYPDIKEAEVVLWPKVLVKKIPKNKERVRMYIEDGGGSEE